MVNEDAMMADWRTAMTLAYLIGFRSGDDVSLEPLTSGAAPTSNFLIYNVFSAYMV